MRKVISLSRFERWLKWRSFSKRLKEVNHDKMDMKSTQVPWHMGGVDITSNSREENDRCNRGPWSSSALLDSLAVHSGGNLDTALLLHTLLLLWNQCGPNRGTAPRCIFLLELCKCMSVVAMGQMLGGLIISIGSIGAQSTTDDRFDNYGRNLLCKDIDSIWIKCFCENL